MSNLQVVNPLPTSKNFEMGELDTFPKILRHNAKNWPNEIAMREKEFGICWRLTWNKTLACKEVKSISDGIIHIKIVKREEK